MQTIVELARDASRAGHDLSALFQVVCEHFTKSLGVERAVAYRYVTEDEEVVPMAHCGAGARGELGRRRFPLKERAQFARAYRKRRPEVAHNFVVVPLLASGSCRGFVAGDRAGAPIEIGEKELEPIETLASVAGTIVAQAEQICRLERSAELANHFIGLASHEIRGPVAVIQGVAATLHDRIGELASEQVTILHTALHTQAQHLAQLVHQLLDLSRLDAQAIQLEKQCFLVREHVERIARLVAADRLADLEIDVPGDLETVADPTAVDRILANLVANAFRYGRPPVRIAACQVDHHFRIVVEDRGAGIASEFVPRLFERFTRSSSEQDGTGLGLAIAQSYAHAHGGELLYEDAKPHGARFELVLPAHGNGR